MRLSLVRRLARLIRRFIVGSGRNARATPVVVARLLPARDAIWEDGGKEGSQHMNSRMSMSSDSEGCGSNGRCRPILRHRSEPTVSSRRRGAYSLRSRSVSRRERP